jgi:hypothetical protein
MAPAANWTSVASSADGTKLVAAATINPLGGGLIYASTNSGLTWTLTGAPTNNHWTAVASSADGSKLVAASQFEISKNYGGVYTSTNFGMTWTSNNVPAAAWASVASSADGTKLVAVGGGIYTSTNSGTTWVSNNVPSYNWCSVASSADGGTLVAAIFDHEFGLGRLDPGYIYTSQTTPALSINLTPVNGNLTLAWLVPSTNFVLQQSSDLSSWTNVTNAPALNLTNLQDEVVLSPTNSSGFYRLKTP